MTETTPRILAVGAAGSFAGLVVPALARRGARVRGLIRDPADADRVRDQGATEIAVGDLRDRASVEAALAGVDAVFYIAPAFIDDEVGLGQNVVETAKRAGVRRFVFSSVIHPTLSALENHRAKGPVEEAVLASDMEFTFLHPTLFFQDLDQGWPNVVKTGVFAQPWSTETRFTWVDYRDVAEVAAIALTEDRLVDGTFEICAAGNLNRHDVAALMSEALGRTIRADRLKPPAGDDSEGDQMVGLRKMFDWYDQHGLLGNALTLTAILGHEPRTLRTYLQELAAKPLPAG